jgi:hypothetical protein
LPGWYAQKHPDEDWAETFAVWMTPGADWRADYAQLPTALAKLEYCDRMMKAIAAREPLVTAAERDEDVSGIHISVADFYRSIPAESEPGAAGLDGDLRAIFDDLAVARVQGTAAEARPAGALIRKLERQLMSDVFRWTGHFPEKTRSLMRHLAKRAEALEQVYAQDAESAATVGVTILVTSLAMNFIHRGAYFPETVAQTAAQSAAAAAAEAKEAAEIAEKKTAEAAEANGSRAAKGDAVADKPADEPASGEQPDLDGTSRPEQASRARGG